MKKIISILLCLVMVLSSVALLASCRDKTDEGVEVKGKPVTVDLAAYSVVYNKKASSAFVREINQFTTDVSKQLKTSLKIERDGGEVTNNNLEIIIGTSVRAEAVETLTAIKDNGWAIRMYPETNKIIITGTTDFLTTVAMDYFLNHYVTADALNGTQVSVHEKITANKVAMLNLVEDGQGTFSIVYGSDIDDQKGSSNGAKTRTYGDTNNTGNDFPYDIANKVKTQLITMTKAMHTSMPYARDSAEPAEREVQVGIVNRTESQEERAKLASNQYSLVVRNNKVVLGALSDTMLASAYALYEDMIIMSAIADAEGNVKTVSIPAEYSRVETVESTKWVVDFPKPDNVTLLENMDVGSNALLHVYTGDGSSRSGFEAYCRKLEGEGYTVLAPETTMSDSSFVTYIHEGKDIILHISHTAHKYAEQEGVNEFLNSLRVVSASTDYVQVDKTLFSSDRNWTKLTDPMITQYEANRSVGAWGNQFIITLEDGTFILFDGGHAGVTGSSNDEVRLYNVLKDLHTKVHGKAPDKDNPIRISAWLISHEHSDHFGVFNLFCNKYGPQSDVLIERLLYNFSSDEENYNTGNPETKIRNNLATLQSNADNFDAIKVHAGEKYYIANTEIHILYTHEEIYPQRLEFFNNSSTVFRLSLGITDAEKNTVVSKSNIARTETLILLGDLERVGSMWLRSMYSTEIESTMVQVAHHGYNGCEEKLYKNINPVVLWWPTPNGTFIDQTKKDGSDWIRAANYGVAHEIPNVRMIIVHGDFNTTLTLTKNGPDYENLYDALEHDVVQVNVNPRPDAGVGNVIYRPVSQ